MHKYPTTNPVEEFNRTVDLAGLTKGVQKYKNPTGKVLSIKKKLYRTFLNELMACKTHLCHYASHSSSFMINKCFPLHLKSAMVSFINLNPQVWTITVTSSMGSISHQLITWACAPVKRLSRQLQMLQKTLASTPVVLHSHLDNQSTILS